MGVNTGKRERTDNKILEALAKEREKYPSSWITNVDVARKVRLTPATASGYLKDLWQRGRVLRAGTVGGGWAYRCVLDAEDLERHKVENPGHYAWRAYVEPQKGRVIT